MTLPPSRTRPTSITKVQILQDLEAVAQEEEQWHMLYRCLEDAPPREPNLSQIEELFAGTKGLDGQSETLLDMVEALEKMKKKLAGLIAEMNAEMASSKGPE